MHYYSEKQDSPLIRNDIKIKVFDQVFSLTSAGGIFSKDGLDKASKLLIENSDIPKNAKVLDLGCGYGVVGISLLKKYDDLELTFSDVNERALLLTKENLKKQGLKGKVIKSDSFDNIKEVFDYILTNPPIAAGRKKCYELIEQSHSHLKKGGSLYLVARHKKGGEMLQKKMEEHFFVSVVAKGSGFRVYKGTKE